MVDIDRFKAINDAHGHVAGDEVIRSVAQTLREGVREEDIVCRYGGEEFLVFLQKRDEQQAFVVAERIRKAVASQSIDFEGRALSVTVSVGGSLRSRVSEIDEAIKQADAALYQAKKCGRDRTVFESYEPTALTG